MKEGKDFMGAEKMLRKASELAPDDLDIHRQLGAVIALNLVHNSMEVGTTL
jgi:Flp pilus assembly protein TadD